MTKNSDKLYSNDKIRGATKLQSRETEGEINNGQYILFPFPIILIP